MLIEARIVLEDDQAREASVTTRHFERICRSFGVSLTLEIKGDIGLSVNVNCPGTNGPLLR